MSIESMAIALNHSRASGTAKVVILGIANHNGDGGAWPAVSTLARYANVDKRSVQRSLDQLERLGEIRRVWQQGGDHATADHRRPNLYKFLLTCPVDCDRSSQHRTSRLKAVITELDGISRRVTETSPHDIPVTGRGDASVTRTIPSTKPRLKEETQVTARGLCIKGHPIIGISGGGLPFCADGHYAPAGGA